MPFAQLADGLEVRDLLVAGERLILCDPLAVAAQQVMDRRLGIVPRLLHRFGAVAEAELRDLEILDAPPVAFAGLIEKLDLARIAGRGEMVAFARDAIDRHLAPPRHPDRKRLLHRPRRDRNRLRNAMELPLVSDVLAIE